MAFDHHISARRRHKVLRLAIALLVVAGTGNIGNAQASYSGASTAEPEYVQLDQYLLPQIQTPASGKQFVDAPPLSMMVPACALLDPEARGKITIGIAALGIDPPVAMHLIAAQSMSSGL